MVKAGNQTLLKKNNQRAIAEFIIAHGPISRADLSKKLNISKPTVSANTLDLIERNILQEVGYDRTDIGKKPMLIDFNRNYSYVLALDFISCYNENKVLAAVCNLYCEPLFIDTITLPAGFTAMNVKHDIPKGLFRMFDSYNIAIEKIGKLVMSAPTVWYDNSHVAYECRSGEKVNLVDILKPYFKNKIIVKNDISLAALGEKYFGEGKNADNVMFAWIGTAIGGGVIVNGRLYEGADLSGGEFAYTIVHNPVLHTNEFLRDIVDKGGIERYVMANREAALKSSISDKLLSKSGYNVLDLVDAANHGDEFCIGFARYVGKIAAQVVMNFAHTMDMQTAIVGGEYSLFGAPFFDEFDKACEGVPLAKVHVVMPQHKNSAVYGAFKVGAEGILDMII